MVARWWKALRKSCPSCTVLGVDLLDWPGVNAWAKRFVKAAGRAPKVWGLHNYVGMNQLSTRSTLKLMKAVPGKFWLTETGGLVDATCANRSAPSDDLKRVFRDLAKAIHPDLASDDAARRRRHALMAEANRAYAERDEDRLRLIQRAWERHPEAAIDESPGADRRRTLRLIVEIEERLVAIGGEFADLRSSAIWQLKGKIDDAKAQGWDLFAEMILQVKRDIGRAKARLASAERAIRTAGSSAFGG